MYQFMNLLQIPENQNWKNNPRIFYNSNEINTLMPFAISFSLQSFLKHWSDYIPLAWMPREKEIINLMDYSPLRLFKKMHMQHFLRKCVPVYCALTTAMTSYDARSLAQIFADRQFMVNKFWSKNIQGKLSVRKLQYFCGLSENQKTCLEKLMLYILYC